MCRALVYAGAGLMRKGLWMRKSLFLSIGIAMAMLIGAGASQADAKKFWDQTKGKFIEYDSGRLISRSGPVIKRKNINYNGPYGPGTIVIDTSERRLYHIYEEGKDRFPDPNFPEPGFKRRRRAEFHFVRADFNRFLEAEKAKLLPEITDEEIETEYENNKSRYVIPAAPAEPEAALVPTSGEPEGADPVDSTGADASSEAEPPTTDVPEPAETPESDDQGRLNGPNYFFVSSVSQDETDASEPTGTAPTSEPTEAAEAGAAATEITQPAESGIEDPAVAVNPDETDGASNESEETSEEVNYRPLDDALRAEIREELADNQARKPAQDRLDNGLTQVRRQVDAYARKLRGSEFGKADAGPIEAFSLEQLDLDELLETGDVPLVDAISVKEYELGQAFETEFVSWPPRRIEFDQVAFQEGISLYRPGQISGADSGITFVYWKTENREPEVPEFSEVRDEVVEAWKRREALKLAKQEAEELCTAANAKSGERLSEASAGQEAHSVVTTDLFSWLSTGLNPSGMGAPGISNVQGVEGIGPSFMESVFALDQGEAGVAINQPENVVYVVKIVIESPTEEVLRQRFLESGVTFEVSSIANEDNIQLQRQWYEDLEREFGVVWRRPPE